jgi:superfamily II DNA or RNA helicase
MQHAGAMSSLSPAEDLKGRLAYAGLTLRHGQEAMIDYVDEHPGQQRYNVVLPTGYGKSKLAEGVFDVLKGQGRVTRALFIVPTDTQREQYVSGINGDRDRYGFNIRGAVHCRGESADISAAVENTADVFVTTIQAIHTDIGFYRDLMSKGRWLVVADEYHRLKADNKWASTFNVLSHDVVLGMTATVPGRETVFKRRPDVEVSFEQAIDEGAIRRVKAHIEHYFIDVVDDDGDVTRVTTENIETNREKIDLRHSAKYISSILTSAHDCLEQKNLEHPGEHQMLVFAMGIAHAESVSNILNAMHGGGYSDWIGMSRSKSENDDVMARYKSGELMALVQVDKAGEGFDHPRASVLVFLQLLSKATPKALQHAGRGLRRNYGIAQYDADVCHMFASPDTEMAELARDLALASTPRIEEDLTQEGEGQGSSPFYDIPEVRIVDTEHDRTEIISRIPQKQVDDTRERVSAKRLDLATVSDDRLRRAIAEDRLEQMQKAIESADPRKYWRDRVVQATELLAGNVARVRFRDSGSEPKTYRGDLMRTINSRSIQILKKKHDQMSADDFKAKYQWLRDLNAEIKASREIPKWLLV